MFNFFEHGRRIFYDNYLYYKSSNKLQMCGSNNLKNDLQLVYK